MYSIILYINNFLKVDCNFGPRYQYYLVLKPSQDLKDNDESEGTAETHLGNKSQLVFSLHLSYFVLPIIIDCIWFISHTEIVHKVILRGHLISALHG